MFLRFYDFEVFILQYEFCLTAQQAKQLFKGYYDEDGQIIIY